MNKLRSQVRLTGLLLPFQPLSRFLFPLICEMSLPCTLSRRGVKNGLGLGLLPQPVLFQSIVPVGLGDCLGLVALILHVFEIILPLFTVQAVLFLDVADSRSCLHIRGTPLQRLIFAYLQLAVTSR